MADQFLGGTALPASHKDTRGGIPTRVGPYIGVVKDNVDPTRSGRVRVWIKSHSSDQENNPEHWRTVSYLSPFYGVTPHGQVLENDNPSFSNNAQAYGMWMTAPDLGVEVLCFFVEGDPNQGYYVGYIPESQMNHMVPAAGARTKDTIKFDNTTQETAFADATQIPVVEIQKSTEGMNDVDYYKRTKPLHSVIAAQMWQAGTITDNVRGPIGTSSQRESPSYAYGISTPGRPIFSNGILDGQLKSALSTASARELAVIGRRGGHSFVMDDGDVDGKDVLMRFRTSAGHQITMSDDGACVYILHANGQTWMELGNEGTVDIYAANSINLRTQGELNFHADKNINFHSGQDIQMYAKRNIKVEGNEKLDVIGKTQFTAYSEKLVTVKSDGPLYTQSAEKTTLKASKNVNIQGEQVHLNSEPANTVQKTKYLALNKLAETQFEKPKGWQVKPAKLETITTRAPTHEPYIYHNQGVPVKVEIAPTTASPPPAKTAAKVAAVAQQPVANPVSPAEVVKQGQALGEIKAIGACSKEEVVGMLAQKAKDVAQPLEAITEKGIGKFAIPADMLVNLGVIKPGIVADITKLTAAELDTFLQDPSIFTGKLNINSVADMLSSEKLQGSIMQAGMDFAYGQLKATGILSGLETAKDMAGLLSGAMSKSPGEIADWVAGKADAAVSGVLDQVAKAGQFASTLAATKANNLINNALSGVQDITAGVSKSITDVVGTVQRIDLDGAVDELVANVKIPSLSAASRAVQNTLKLESGEFLGQIDAAGNLVDLGKNLAMSAENITGKIGDVKGLVGGAVDQVGNIVDEANNVVGSVVNQATSVATQVKDAAGNVVNTATGLADKATDLFDGAVKNSTNTFLDDFEDNT